MRMTTRRTRAAATVSAATAALLLAACGGQDVASESLTATPSTTASSPSIEPAPATPTTPTTSSTSSSASTSSSSSTTEKRQTPHPTATATPTHTRTATPSQQPTHTSTPTPTPSATPSSSAAAGGDDEPSPSSSSTSASPSPSASSSTQPPLNDDGKVLAMGSSGPRVKAAQQRLGSLNYFIPAPDGNYGGGTRQAVWAIQKVAGLPRTGKIDAATQDAIDRGVQPKPRISNGIEIDLGKQILMVVEGGKAVKVMNASSGNGETFKYPVKGDDGKVTWHTAKATTPTGTWTIYMERNVLWESTLELGTLYRPKYVTGGIAIHGAPSVPAQPASHGCIRVSNAAMDWLWSSGNAVKGQTRVTIR